MTKTTWVAIVALVTLAAGAAWWQNRATPPAEVTAGMGGARGSTAPALQAGGSAAVPGASGRGGPGGGLPTVEVGKVQTMTLVDDVSAVGSLRSRQNVMLRPEVSGRVARLTFRDGERVKQGQLLVQLDDTLQKAQRLQAVAQSSIATTNLARSRELLAQGFVSQSAVDQNVAALEVAQAQVALADAQLARMTIVAPFDAVAGIRVANIGDYLKDGADIVTLDDLSAVLVDFRLPERYLPQLRLGLGVELSLDAVPGRLFAGRVEALDTQVDANGRSLLVRARVENPGALLKPGMFARPRVVFSRRENAVVVPEEALVPQGARQFVYIVVDGENGQKTARKVEARIGLRLPGQVELLAGAKAGDLVVTAGHSRLRGDSTVVRVIQLGRPAAPGGQTPDAAPGLLPANAPNARAASGAPA